MRLDPDALGGKARAADAPVVLVQHEEDGRSPPAGRHATYQPP